MFKFTSSEVRDLIIAFIVISLCFGIATTRKDVQAILFILPIVMVGVGTGFILHELGHKFVSMKYGYWAEFKLWPQGLLVALVTSVSIRHRDRDRSHDLRGRGVLVQPGRSDPPAGHLGHQPAHRHCRPGLLGQEHPATSRFSRQTQPDRRGPTGQFHRAGRYPGLPQFAKRKGGHRWHQHPGSGSVPAGRRGR